MSKGAVGKAQETSDTTTAPLWWWGFIALLVIIPLPFGSNRPWAADLLGVISAVLLAAMLWNQRHTPAWTGRPPLKRLIVAGTGLTGVILWSFVQTAPWTPLAWHHPIWLEASHALGPLSGSISVDPSAFAESLVRLLGYIACFLLAFFGGRDPSNAYRLLKSLALAGSVYALYGLLEHSTGSEHILWFKKWAYKGFLTSTFVNKNSYAAYAGIGLLCSLSYAWESLKHLQPKDRVLADQSRAAALFLSLKAEHIARLCLPIAILAALALTGSRAGVTSSLLGALGLLAAIVINRRARLAKWIAIAGALLGVFVLFVAVGGDALVSRMSEARLDEDTSLRLAGYTLAGQAIADNPWLGFGLGSFETAFRLYRDSSLPLWFQHAHNDYFELAIELGLPAAFVFLASLALVISCCLSGVWARKRSAIYSCLATASTILLMAHALVDFSFQIPAIAATYAALLGLGVAQSWSTRAQKPEELKKIRA